MAVNLSPVGGVAAQFLDNNGNVLTGGKIYTYAAGTTTPQASYISAAGTTAHSNPIILDASGRVPGGEIWLTDGLQYKVAIYTADNVLIGTYDNVIGINSNFVNFVTSEEVQIATAGQTVFTLTTMQYTPGTNNLVVYVDGVNQVEGGSYSFVETDSTTVTFTSGLHVGAVVKFVSAEVLSTNVTSASTTTFTGFNSQVGVVQDIADADGSDWIGFEPAGTGAVARSVESKLRETVSVKDFGAVGDGVTDDTAAIQAAIDYVGSINGGVIGLPQGTYGITSQLNVPYSNVILQGCGSDNIHDGGSSTTPATSIKWISPSTSAKSMISFYTPSSVSESKRVGGGIRDIFIDCDGKVAGGINLLSYNKGNFLNITIYSPTYVGVILNCYQAGTIAEAADTQSNIFEQISVRCLTTESANAHGFHLTSSDPANPSIAAANSSFNTFIYCDAQVKNGHAVWMNDADNNTFNNCRGFVVSPGTGYGLLLQGAADANYFYGASFGSIRIAGVASSQPVNSIRNCFVCVDSGNGTAYPTIDAGCRIYWLDHLGVQTNARTYKLVAADSVVAANNFYNKYPLVSAVFPNDSNANAVWCNTADTNRWRTYTGQVYSASNVDFAVSQLAGSGKYCVESSLVVRDDIFNVNMPTTSAGANVHVDNASTPANRFYRSTSSLKYKTHVETLDATYSNKLLEMRPVWYRSLSPVDRKDWSWFGLIAEELAEVEPRLVNWSYSDDSYNVDENGIKTLKQDAKLIPDGVQYDRLTVLLLDMIQRQEKRIAELERKLNGDEK